jgi:hypothetical protein
MSRVDLHVRTSTRFSPLSAIRTNFSECSACSVEPSSSSRGSFDYNLRAIVCLSCCSALLNFVVGANKCWPTVYSSNVSPSWLTDFDFLVGTHFLAMRDDK